MERDKNHITFSAADIEKYWKGQLTQQEMHTMEKAALDDPFLADAMEGYRNAKANIDNDVDELKRRLKNRVDDKNVVSVPRTKWWRLAAVFILLAGLGAVIYRLINENPQQELAVKKQNVSFKNKGINDSSSLDNLIVQKDSAALIAKNDNKGYKTDTIPYPLAGKVNAIKNSSPADDAAKYQTPALQERETIDKAKEFSVKKEPAGNEKPNADSNYVFSGKVMDNNYKPVHGASIYVRGLQKNVATDVNGLFNFYAKDTVANVTVKSAGFEQADISLRNSTSSNNIILKENENMLAGKASGVVVSGYGSRSKKSLTKMKAFPVNVQNAMPVVGWEAYNVYIEKNKKIPDSLKNQTGEVEVSFFVDKNGVLSEFNIERSVAPSLDEEAIRLINEGPGWKLTKRKKSKVTLRIKF